MVNTEVICTPQKGILLDVWDKPVGKYIGERKGKGRGVIEKAKEL